MKKVLLFCLLLTGSLNLFAQDKPAAASKTQFILIIRSKTDFSGFSKDSIQSNIKHWMAYMGNLGRAGKIAGGYHLGTGGIMINDPAKAEANIAGGQVVSAFMIINAADMDEAKAIARKCPVFELGGNVEVRPIMDTAH